MIQINIPFLEATINSINAQNYAGEAQQYATNLYDVTNPVHLWTENNRGKKSIQKITLLGERGNLATKLDFIDWYSMVTHCRIKKLNDIIT